MFPTNKTITCSSCFMPITDSGLEVQFHKKTRPLHLHRECSTKFQETMEEGHNKVDETTLITVLKVVALYMKEQERKAIAL